MYTKISKEGIEIVHPEIKYTEDGQVIIEEVCWVDGEWLGCYGWDDEDQLLVLSTIEEDFNEIPEIQHFVYNTDKKSTGWVLRSQVKKYLYEE